MAATTISAWAPLVGRIEDDRLLQVVVDRPAFLDGLRDGREVVVREHHLGRFLGRFGAFQAHRHADVGALQRRRVVDAVARHRDHPAARLQALHQPQLVLGAGAREHVDLGCARPQGGIVEGIDLQARQDLGGIDEAQLRRDGARRLAVVARDHLDADAGGLAARHRRDRLLARRIEQTEQADHREPPADVVEVQPAMLAGRAPRRQGQDALPARADLRNPRLPVGEIKRLAAFATALRRRTSRGCARVLP